MREGDLFVYLFLWHVTFVILSRAQIGAYFEEVIRGSNKTPTFTPI